MKGLKSIVIAMLAILAAMPLCAGGSKEADGPVVLEILVSADTTEGAPMQKAVARFNEEYKDKGIQAEVNEIAYADLQTQITNRARAGELPALVKNTTGTLDLFVDLYYPLDETGLNPDDFGMDYCVRDGRFIATVLNITANGMYINKTAFDKAGVSYPLEEEDRWTWDEFVEAVREVKEKSGIDYGFSVDYSQDRLLTVLYQFGSRLIEPGNPQVLTLRSEETKNAIDFLSGCIQEGLYPLTVGTGIDNAANTFKAGRTAANIGGNWNLTDFKNNIKDFEFTPCLMPYEVAKATKLGGNLLSVFDGTGVEKEAIEFVKWFYQPENYTQYLNDANYLSGLTTLDIEYNLPELAIFQQEMKVSNSAANDDIALFSAHPGSSFGNSIRDNMALVFAGEISTDEAIDRMVNDIITAYPDVTEAE